MLAVYSWNALHLPLILSGIPHAEPRVVASDWEALEDVLASADCLILGVEWLGERNVLPLLTKLRAGSPDVPIVLVTRQEANNVRLLKGLIVEELVWLHEARGSLAHAIADARTRGMFHVLRNALGVEQRLSTRLREALLYACHADRAVHSVFALAAAVRCDRRTLWHGWHRAVGPYPRLEDLLHWLLLLRAASLKSSANSWTDVALELDVDERTLARHARRLAHLGLRDLAIAERGSLIGLFLSDIVKPVLPHVEWTMCPSLGHNDAVFRKRPATHPAPQYVSRAQLSECALEKRKPGRGAPLFTLERENHNGHAPGKPRGS